MIDEIRARFQDPSSPQYLFLEQSYRISGFMYALKMGIQKFVVSFCKLNNISKQLQELLLAKLEKPAMANSCQLNDSYFMGLQLPDCKRAVLENQTSNKFQK